MTIAEKGSLLVYLSKTESGTILAASNEPPYFCFEAETEEEIQSLIQEAIDLCLESRDTVPQSSLAVHLDTLTPVWVRQNQRLEVA